MPVPKPDVEEWIAKARESIEAFGGFIGAGGAGMTKSYLVNEDPEDSGSSGDDAYEFAVEDEDGETVEIGDHDSQQQRRSTSREMQSVHGSSVGSGFHKRDSSGSGIQKLVTLPSEASPFGLIANLSLKHRKRRSGPSAEDEDNVGVANEDFFRPSMFSLSLSLLCSLLVLIGSTPDPIRSHMLSDRKQIPHILTRGVITPDEAEKLFRM
jgi:hypothetical protein